MLKNLKPFYPTTGIFILMILLVGTTLTGCDDDNATGTEEEDISQAEVVIEPQNVTLEVDEEVDFSAFVVNASGDTINDELDIDWNWYSSDPDVFTVLNNGTATGHNPGEAFCIVEASTANSKIVAKMVPIGLDSAHVLLF